MTVTAVTTEDLAENKSLLMKLHLTEAQLLQEWRLRYLPQPVNTGAAVTVTGGYDMEAIIKARMRDWYSRLVAAADPAMLAPVEIGDRITLLRCADGSAMATMPPETVKVMEVNMEGWAKPAIVTADSQSRTAIRQRSPYSRGDTESPVVVIDSTTMRIYSPPPDVGSISVTALVDEHDIYHLDSAALATIQSFYSEITP